ncbi:MAG: hypothetical protein KDA68_18420 [Planctomycetaceae bacterium]|nr:hypothetical protein [Planctomycetaceae bacterium]
MRTLLIMHLVAVILASTDYSILTAPFNGGLHWEYFRYKSFSGWGPNGKYTPDNSLLVVVTYLIGYVLGAVSFPLAVRKGNPWAGILGTVLSLVGIVSFGIEVSHWVWMHNSTWMAYAPSLMVLLALRILWTQRSHRHHIPEPA